MSMSASTSDPTPTQLSKKAALSVDQDASYSWSWLAETRTGEEFFRNMPEGETVRKLVKRSSLVMPLEALMLGIIFVPEIGLLGAMGAEHFIFGMPNPFGVPVAAMIGESLYLPALVASGWVSRQLLRKRKMSKSVKPVTHLQFVGLTAWLRTRYNITVWSEKLHKLGLQMLSENMTWYDFDDVNDKTWQLVRDEDDGWRVVDPAATRSGWKDGLEVVVKTEAPIVSPPRSKPVDKLANRKTKVRGDDFFTQFTDRLVAAFDGDAPSSAPAASSPTASLGAEKPLPRNIILLLNQTRELIDLLSGTTLSVEHEHVLRRATIDSNAAVTTYRNLARLGPVSADSGSQLVKVLKGLIGELEEVQRSMTSRFEDDLKIQSEYVGSRSAVQAIRIPTE